MKAKVLTTFTDGEAKKIRYEGQIIDLSEERFTEIMSINDRLIEEIEEVIEYPKHIGGGRYQLSNGEKIKGKEEALTAENELKNKQSE